MFTKIKRLFQNRKQEKQFTKPHILKKYDNVKIYHSYNCSIFNVLDINGEIEYGDHVETKHFLSFIKFNPHRNFWAEDGILLKSAIEKVPNSIEIVEYVNLHEKTYEAIEAMVKYDINLMFQNMAVDIFELGLLKDYTPFFTSCTILKNRRKKGLYLLQTKSNESDIEIYIDDLTIAISNKNKSGYVRFNPEDKFQKAHHDWIDDGSIYEHFIEAITKRITDGIFKRIIDENLLPLTENQKSYVKP